MTRGPKPKPTRLKLLEGVRADRINGREPIFPPASTEPPNWLEGYALMHWNELAPFLSSTGRLTVADRSALEQFCLDYALIREAKDEGPIETVSSRRGRMVVRTDPNNADGARRRYLAWLIEFGLTPASRSRVAITKGLLQDRMSELFNQQTRRP